MEDTEALQSRKKWKAIHSVVISVTIM